MSDEKHYMWAQAVFYCVVCICITIFLLHSCT